MLTRIASTWERVRDSLWALPLAVSLLCGVLAGLALWIELPWIGEVAWLYAGGPQQAPDFASALVGAMITLTALAFSITMVVLALAAQQLGPRLIEHFMSDRGTQAALGLFMGTVVYLLLILRAMDGAKSSTSPALAITGGTFLVLVSVVTFLFFVHSLARSIVSDTVVARVGDTLDRAICGAFPAETAPGNDEPAPSRGAPIRLPLRGYVQRIDYASLVRAAQRQNAVVELAYDAGAHVINGQVDGWIIATGDLSDTLRASVVFGAQRNAGHDPEWSVRQLVEIALRALSPGVNDVFTALAVIDRLALAMALLAERGDAPRVWRDESGAARVFGPAPHFSLMLDAAFTQIREAGPSQFAVLRRLAEKLDALAGATRHGPALERHFAAVERAARRLPETDDAILICAILRQGRDRLAAVA